MKVALFGGSFNPPHLGHVISAYYLLENAHFDHVWVLPCFNHPFDKQLLNFDTRFEMCDLAFDVLSPRIVVSGFEKIRGGKSYTFDMVKHFQSKYPKINFELVIGSDNLSGFNQWHKSNELQKIIKIHTLPRGNAHLEKGFVIPNISSEDIRDKLIGNCDISHLVPSTIHHYITKNSLYRTKTN